MKIIGFDFGDARVGVALSDVSEKFAFAGKTLFVSGIDDAVKQASSTALSEKAELAVVGLPLNMDGTESFRAARTRRFAELFTLISEIKCVFFDERLTSVEAYTYMNITQYNGRKRRKVIDSLSAQIILQAYLDMRKNQS